MNSTPQDPHGRREPTLSGFDALALGERGTPASRSPRPPAGRAWRWWALAGAGLLVVLVLLFRGPLARHVMPQTRAQTLVLQGAQALDAGRLTAADGTGARELYEAAVAIDPDRAEARAGLARVAAAALAQSRAALAHDRFGDAHAALRLARELSVPRAEADAVEAMLRQRESAHAGIDGWLAHAETARAEGRFDGDAGSALPLYARILALQPRHADALRGREDAIGALLDDAREQLRGGDIDAAARAIAIASRYDAGHVDLPETQARLTEELEALRRRADGDFARGRIARAVSAWRLLLQRDPADADALAGLQRAAEAYAAQARRQASDFHFAEAEALLREASALAPDSEAVRVASAQVERSRRAERANAAPVPAPERRRRVARLLEDAAAAEQRGDLLSPPGDSAYDKLRAAQALAPGDPQVGRAGARLLPAARSCFDAGLRANDLGRARGCLDARVLLGEDAVAIAQARSRLAQRWIAIGDERLAAGHVEGARDALRTAQAMAPGVAGAEDLRARLQAASVSDGTR